MGFLKGLFGKSKGESRGSKVVMLGLDGTPYTMLKEIFDKGVMPNFKSLIENGTFRQMDSSTPAISAIAWTSFMTGKNPGKHRIFGFIDLQKNSYQFRFPNYAHCASETFWDVMGRAGKRSIIINQPSTYPAKEMNGICIAGFVAIDLKKAVYPPSILPKLEKWGYRIDVDANKGHEDMEGFIADLFDTLEKRIAAIKHFYNEEEWDYFQGVITGTDRLHHFLYGAFADPTHRYHDTFLEFYRRVDKFIGEIAEKAGEDATLMLMSDHGFTTIKKEIALNYWLRENGYLKFEKEPPENLADISSESKAFALDPSRIFINTKGKFPKGSVEPGAEEKRLTAEIAEKCRKMTIPGTGEQIIETVHTREEAYKGPHIEEAAEIILTPKWHYDIKGTIKKMEFASTGNFTGMHTHDDAFFFINRKDIRDDSKVNIMDVAPTILKLMGFQPPDDMDGKVLLA
jgi:predicted AlkP superfamily phosphohydrolase/phosphomutase